MGDETPSSSSSGGFDMNKLGTPQKIVGIAAIVYVVSTFLPWYSVSAGPYSAGVNGFRFPMILGDLAALAAIVGVVFTAMGTKMNMQVKPGMVQLILAGVGVVCSVLGIVIKPGGSYAGLIGISVSWGLFLGIIVSLVWAYGAFMWKQSET